MTEIDRLELKDRVKAELKRHVGPNDCITMTALHSLCSGEAIVPWRRYDQSRLVRSLVAELRREGCPIANKGGRGGGYFWAASEAQLATTIGQLHSRALSSLRQEAALKRISIKELIEQYTLELNDEPKEATA